MTQKENIMVKVRLHGTLDELKQAQELVRSQFEVLSESEPYKDRGKTECYRVYMDCEVKSHGKEECS